MTIVWGDDNLWMDPADCVCAHELTMHSMIRCDVPGCPCGAHWWDKRHDPPPVLIDGGDRG